MSRLQLGRQSGERDETWRLCVSDVSLSTGKVWAKFDDFDFGVFLRARSNLRRAMRFRDARATSRHRKKCVFQIRSVNKLAGGDIALAVFDSAIDAPCRMNITI
jgi:hypothetical protein